MIDGNEERQSRFAEILRSDDLGLLDVPGRKQEHNEEDKRLIESFQEITQFFEENNRLPSLEGDIIEYSLACRFDNIKSDVQKVGKLQNFDLYNLLRGEVVTPPSLDELIADDPLGLLASNDEADSILNLVHIKPSNRVRPEYIARRRVCKDFDAYEDAFQKIHKELEDGRRRLVEFRQEDLVEGRFFVLRGVVFLLETDDSEYQEFTYQERSYRRKEGRTRCIFDNGTESVMLFRSLVKAMGEDGYSISADEIKISEVPPIELDDVQNGFIYVLRSLSREAEVRQKRHLYKIGYCSGSISNRLKNAANEPTYLMSDVEVVLAVRCYNLNVSYLEASIHDFFNGCNLHIKVTDNQGIAHFPREWFDVPLSIVEDAISLIVNREIEQYCYDASLKLIIKKA